MDCPPAHLPPLTAEPENVDLTWPDQTATIEHLQGDTTDIIHLSNQTSPLLVTLQKVSYHSQSRAASKDRCRSLVISCLIVA